MKTKNWEARFDEEFETKKTIDGTRKYWKIYQSEDGEILYRLSNGKFFPQDIVDFITTLLQKQKDEIIRDVKNLIKKL